MMKEEPWTPASLYAVGGIEGVGATFLEETFSAATATPKFDTIRKQPDLKARSLTR
jgi:hypothetical protein